MSKFKKLFILSILIFVFIVSLQTSFAANVNINNTSSGGINGALGSVNNGDNIVLSPGTYNKINQDYNIAISKNVTIKGNGPTNSVIIDARKNSGIFSIGSNNITFINITFTNGYNSGDGGAIYNNNGNITFINCNFINNTARYGGAINNAGGSAILIVNNCTFVENLAFYGGVIRNAGGSAILIVNNCTFVENSVTWGGGAIYNYNGGSITLTGCIFVENSAGDGGVICNYGSVTLTNCNFIKNSANSGGAIFNGVAILTVNNCTFTENLAIHSGGAIYNYGSATLIGCIFVENSATNFGGGAILNQEGFLTLSDCTFIKNSATSYYGGSICNYGSVTLTGCIFVENSAIVGGAIYSYGPGSSLKVYSVVFYKNTGNKTIYINSASICDLKDNFYFWVVDQSNPTLDSFISDTINDPSLIGSYYYINISYLPEVTLGDNLSLNYTMKHSNGSGLNNLTVNDITLRQLATIFNNFDFKTTCIGFPLLIDSNNSIGLYYFDELFYQFNIKIQKANTNIVVDSVEGNIRDIVQLHARLTDQWDNPIAGAIVHFYFSNGTYIGNNITGSDGIAIFYYTIITVLDASYYADYNGDDYYNGDVSAFENIVGNNINTTVDVGNGSNNGSITGGDGSNNGSITGGDGSNDGSSTGNSGLNNGSVVGGDGSNSGSFDSDNDLSGDDSSDVGVAGVDKELDVDDSVSSYAVMKKTGMPIIAIILLLLIIGGLYVFRKKYRLAIFLIFMVFLLSISAVSAVTIDENTTGGIAKGITDTTDGKLYLEKGTYNKTNDYGINIGKNIVIQGKGPSGKVIIDAQKNNRIFTIGSNNITFINITFTNGDIPGEGAAIYNNNYVNITFINCNFINNTASMAGAISNDGSVTFTGCTFIENSAYLGGAICNWDGFVTLTDCTFVENSVKSQGGSIYNNGGSAILTVNNCTFAENSAFGENSATLGGAISNSGGSVTLTDCIFTGNSARDGGAICNSGSVTLTVSNCIFVENSATRDGGAICNNGSVTLTGCNFAGNSAGGGGAIYNYGYTDLITNNCIFAGNLANNRGGTIYNEGYSNLTVNNCTFIENSAVSGGAIYNLYGSVTLTDCIFVENSADNFAGTGGAIYNIGGSATLTVNNCIFTGNSAGNGGAIRNDGGSVTLTDCIFAGNSAANGGAIRNDGGSVNLTVNNCIFIGNSAIHYGGAIFNSGSSLMVYSSVFYKNNGNKAIYIYSVNVSDLRDNFYFWVVDQSNPTLDFFIVDTINDPSLIGSYYYINISYLLEVNFGDSLLFNYTIDHSNGFDLDNLTVNDITLRQLAIIFNNFDFKTTYIGFPLLIDSNTPIGLYYFDELFYQFNIKIQKANTNVVVDSVLGNVGDIVHLRARLTDEWGNPIFGAIVHFYFSNGTYMGNNVTGSDGIAIFYYTIATVLDTDYYVVYSGDNSYNGSVSGSQNIMGSKINTNVVVDSVLGNVGDIVQLRAKLIDQWGNPIFGAIVHFYFSNGTYMGNNVTGSDGIAIFYYTIATVLDTSYYADYFGDNSYNGCVSGSQNIMGSKINTNVVVDSVLGNVGDIVQLRAKLIDQWGNHIVGAIVHFYFSNGTHIGFALTGSDGIAIFYYTIATVLDTDYYVVYFGDDSYNGCVSAFGNIVGSNVNTTVDGDNGSNNQSVDVGNSSNDGSVTGNNSLNNGSFDGDNDLSGDDSSDVGIAGNGSNDESVVGDNILSGDDSLDVGVAGVDKELGEDDSVSSYAAMKKTGIPIIAIVLILLIIGGLCVFRKKVIK